MSFSHKRGPTKEKTRRRTLCAAPFYKRGEKIITLQEIQKNIAGAIRTSGMTQSVLAKKLGVSRQTVSHYVKGDKLPAPDTLANLCRISDADANDILGLR